MIGVVSALMEGLGCSLTYKVVLGHFRLLFEEGIDVRFYLCFDWLVSGVSVYWLVGSWCICVLIGSAISYSSL